MEDSAIKKAALLNASSRYMAIIIGLVFTAILARLLSPGDYGVMAVVAVFSTFFGTLSDVGLGPGVIYNQDLDAEDLNSIFSFSVYVALFLVVLFLLLAKPVALFYNSGVFVPICYILSISLFFSTMNTVPGALLMKKKLFKKVAVRNIVIVVVTNVVTIVLSVLNFKYYSLAIGATFSSFFLFIWNAAGSGLKFRIKFKLSSIKKVLRFSFFQFSFNIVNYFSRNLDNLLTGKYMGSNALGFYDKAYKLMIYPVQNLTNVITPVLFPFFTEYRDDKPRIYMNYMRVIKLLSLLGVFITVYSYFASREIITVMFGPNWALSIPCFKFLSISIWFQMVTSATGTAFQSLGDTKRMFFVGVINSTISITAIIIGILHKDITVLSQFVGIAFCLHFIVAYSILILRSFKLSLLKFLLSFRNDLIVFVSVVIGALIYPFTISSTLLSFTVKLFYLLVFYAVALLATKEYKSLLNLIKTNKKNN